MVAAISLVRSPPATASAAAFGRATANDSLAAPLALTDSTAGISAKLGDKTLLDALIPAVESIKASGVAGETFAVALPKSAAAAVAGGESTKLIAATKGRASYVGDRSISFPDAGATAIGIIFNRLLARE